MVLRPFQRAAERLNSMKSKRKQLILVIVNLVLLLLVVAVIAVLIGPQRLALRLV